MKDTFICRIAAGLLALALMAACAPALPETQPAAQPGTHAAESPEALPAKTMDADTAAPGTRAVGSAEFGISLAYPETLAQTAAVEQVAPAPLSADRMFAESHPGYVRVAFGGYALRRAYQLAYPLT